MNWVPYGILGGEECKKLWQRAGGWNSGGYAARGGGGGREGGHRRSYERHALATGCLPSEQRPCAQSWSIAVIMGNAEF